jgi:hypothetical protein
MFIDEAILFLKFFVNMESPNAKKIPKMPKAKLSKMTLDKLALITQQEFTNVYEQLSATNRTMDERFDAVDMRFNAIDRKFEMVDKKFEMVDKRFDAIDRQLKELNFNILGMWSRFDKRLVLLENRVGI